MNQAVSNAMDGFIHKLLQKVRSEKLRLSIEYDPQWPSSCYLQEAESGHMVEWQPQRQASQNTWLDFEKALDIKLHSSIATYYLSYWSDNLQAVHQEGSLELIQIWNESDFERLQQNLIGHFLMKRRLKQRETVFFALTDEEDMILSVLNETGEVVLEQIGLEPQKVIAPDLASFLLSLEPNHKS